MAKTTSVQASDGRRVKAARRSATEWAEEVAAWRRSGSSARAYALARGISASTLAWWASRGDAGHAVSVAAGSRRSPSTVVEAGGREFLPVRIATPAEDTPRIEAEIVLVGGRRVRVAGALTLEQLARLLQVVEGGGVC
jgi:hypothetical protein